MKDDNYIRVIAKQIEETLGSGSMPKMGGEELFDSYALLALSKGVEVTDEDVHDAWSTWATIYEPKSKFLVPFNELAEEVKKEDSRYTKAIQTVAKTLS